MSAAGGRAACRNADVRLPVARSRLSRNFCFCEVDQRLPAIDSPARFTTISAPLTTADHGPAVPSGCHWTADRRGWAGLAAERVRMVTSCPSCTSARDRAEPRNPEPPAITIFIWSSIGLGGVEGATRGGLDMP